MIKLLTFLSPLYICIFWFIIFIVQSKKNKSKLILSMFFLSASIQFIGNYIMFTNKNNEFVWFDFVYLFATLSTLPLLYLYFQSLIKSSKFEFSKTILHFILPSLFSITNIAIVLLMNEHEHKMYFDYYLDSSRYLANTDSILVNVNSYFNVIHRIFFGVQIIFYIALATFYIKKFQKIVSLNYSNLYKRELLWIKYLRCLIILPALFLILMNTFGKQPFLTNEYLMSIPSFFFVFVLFFWGLVGNYQKQLILEIENDMLRSSHSNTETKVFVRNICIKKIESLMLNDEIYKDKDLKIWDLSTLLEIPKDDLTSLLKSEYKQDFYIFVNTFRMKKAKSIIEQKNYDSIQDILDKSGFISLKEFFDVYKKIEKHKPDII